MNETKPNPVVERFFILTPTPTNDPKVFLDAEGKEMKWSGEIPPPAIGAQINVTMNRIGPAIVKGYFESCGRLGIMMLPINPPDWLIRQRKDNPGKLKWQKEGIGCVFGTEFKPEVFMPKSKTNPKAKAKALLDYTSFYAEIECHFCGEKCEFGPMSLRWVNDEAAVYFYAQGWRDVISRKYQVQCAACNDCARAKDKAR